ncbi:hypothetical protein BC831DRAFT_474601 [Entophlyctis helioformis]|nr:hypothetical protein BC831DRAFT_474601 [Entophlyctis helioformis]
MVQAAGAEAAQDGEGAGEAVRAGRCSEMTAAMKATAAGEGTACGQLGQQSDWRCSLAFHDVASAAAVHRRCRCHLASPGQQQTCGHEQAVRRNGECRRMHRQERQTHTETGEQRGSHWTGCTSPAVGISAIKDRSCGLPAAPHTQAAAGGCRWKQGM